MSRPAYILGHSKSAELRLELLNELSTQSFIEALGKLEKKNRLIINLGCGSGHLEEKLAKIFENSHFVCIDIFEVRINEARKRLGTLQTSNTFEFIQTDLTTISIDSLKSCDILISRFVLSHLPNPCQQLERFLPLVKSNGYVCLEELASETSDLYCNTKNLGYEIFAKNIKTQMQAQNSSWDTGFQLLSLLSERSYQVLHTYMTQALLRNARQKSIIRLGIEEARSTLLTAHTSKEIDNMINSLRQFEEDDQSFGLYSRFLTVIAKINSEGEIPGPNNT